MFLRIACATVFLIGSGGNLIARDFVSMKGSSTVFPFATIVAEAMGKNPKFKTPVVESGGSSVGKKGVCEGTGTKFVDIGNASSRMKKKELAFCEENGIKVTEIKVGYDGIVVASSKKGTRLNISRADLGMALTAEVPSKDGSKFVPNYYKKWSDIKPLLPDVPIRVYGPPTTSGTRASFAEMINQKSYCGKESVAKKLSKARGDKKGKKCRAMRTDGAYVEAGEQDNLIVQKLKEDPTAYGIFGFSYLNQNSDTLEGAILDDVGPTFGDIASGKYKASRALYFYVKHSHIDVVPGVKEYMAEWTKHWGPDGVLADNGMIPMSDAEQAKYKSAMTDLPVLVMGDLKK
ncbi:MAG: phosphate ABC transporter substrate-binding protein [Betaproteobacteria bacterium TMED82]|nr:MAG: phosphate ABC transporter substrate-binding protein [Betaproteobacteria bacterium TMED82]